MESTYKTIDKITEQELDYFIISIADSESSNLKKSWQSSWTTDRRENITLDIVFFFSK